MKKMLLAPLFLTLSIFSTTSFSYEIHRLAERGTLGELKIYLESYGHSINQRDKYGWTPLHRAIESGNEKKIYFLLYKGANEKLTTKNGWNAERVARESNHYSQYKNALKKSQNQHFKQAQEINTIDKYRWFISKYPNTSQTSQALKNIKRIQSDIFVKTAQENSIQKYKWFTDNYPDSDKLNEAITLIYDLVKQDGTVEKLQWFTDNYPASKHAEKAIRSIYSFVNKENTIEKYEWFAYNYPDSDEAEKAIDSIYNFVKKENTIEKYQWFADKYPESKNAVKAISSIYLLVKKENNAEKYSWFDKKYSNSDEAEEAYDEIYPLVKKENTIDKYRWFISEYPNSKYVYESLKAIFELLKKENTIDKYERYISEFPDSRYIHEVITLIFNIVKKENNISGFQWFIKKHPQSSLTKDAIKSIHELAFIEAGKINTVSSYNTFIISYPYAKEIEKATQISYQLENNKYQKIKKDDERKARLLAVKIKKMTIAMKKQPKDSQIGYEIIIDRMSRLLTEQYEETDAALRYYESKEFSDFATRFDSTMKSIKNVLNRIENNTENLGNYAYQLIKVTEQGFANSSADRAMTEYRTNQHRKWEKFMHYMDKGYN